MKMRLLTQIPGMTLAIMLTLVVAQGLAFGHDNREEAQHTKKEFRFKGSIQALERYETNGPILSVRALGSGKATHLGRFIVRYDVEVNLPTAKGIASAHFVVAHGDSLFAEGEGQATPTETPNIFTVVEQYQITGGTGRFAKARGSITLDRIVDLNTGETSGTISGNIVIP
jgi:hypothetical protein